jgi:hypothetical protein
VIGDDPLLTVIGISMYELDDNASFSVAMTLTV